MSLINDTPDSKKTKKHHRIGMRDDRLSVGARRGEPEVAETRLIESSRWRRVGHVILDKHS